jgi:hypothetical protein
MYIIRFAYQPTAKMNIHNQCSDFKLINRECFITPMSWNKKPDAEVDAGRMTSADLSSYWTVFEGSLTYQLQRRHVEYND